jgi:hypothetical protein
MGLLNGIFDAIDSSMDELRHQILGMPKPKKKYGKGKPETRNVTRNYHNHHHYHHHNNIKLYYKEKQK